VKSEPRAFASLSSGLLARKGAARPAMRPQGFGQSGGNLDDLGWNDMGHDLPRPLLAPVGDDGEVPSISRTPLAGLSPISPVHDQQAEIAERFASHDEDGEDENGDYVDETAEVYDPQAEAAEAVAFEAAEAEIEEDEEVNEPVAPVFIPQPVVQPAAVRSRRPRAAPGSKAKSAFTLRLDPARHLKLRLACAVDGRSAQQLVTDALDQLLRAMPEVDNMAEKAPRKRADG
jgi:hypothetical protein